MQTTAQLPPSNSSRAASPTDIHPEELSRLNQALILDLRTQQEREGELGFIPGSRWYPSDRIEPELSACLQTDRPVVLVCLSGKRSGSRLSQGFAQSTCDVRSLAGGMLAWRAAGLPTCGHSVVSAEELVPLNGIGDFPRVVMSCFVAESVEAQLAAGDQELIDPRAVVETVFGPPERWNTVDHLLERLDILAESARHLGHPMAQIAVNVDRMRASLLQHSR
jgi:rhodanese-related sulfurtransferase